tara:strand:- start:13211 stop:13420 length:210 start_codon:yes stop_codon:yes gene_type:complete
MRSHSKDICFARFVCLCGKIATSNIEICRFSEGMQPVEGVPRLAGELDGDDEMIEGLKVVASEGILVQG